MRRWLALGFALLAVACGASPEPRAERSPGQERTVATGAPTDDPTAVPPPPPTPIPTHPRWSIVEIGPEERAVLVPNNWRRGCPVPLSDLRWLTIGYRGFDGRVHEGPIVVNETVAEDVRWLFRQLLHAGFPIKHVALPKQYHPNRDRLDTTRSVTSGFNCRPVTERPGTWSQHTYGWAIDVNPLQNPYVRSDGSTLRPAAKPYLDRTQQLPGMIHDGDAVVTSFDAIGWEWGGRWETIKDYMHFSWSGG